MTEQNEERRPYFGHGRQDAGIGTTKHYRIAAHIEEKASRGKTDMFGEKLKGPDWWLIDKIADEKLTGGYNTKKSNCCERCWQFRSTNGKCGCY